MHTPRLSVSIFCLSAFALLSACSGDEPGEGGGLPTDSNNGLIEGTAFGVFSVNGALADVSATESEPNCVHLAWCSVMALNGNAYYYDAKTREVREIAGGSKEESVIVTAPEGTEGVNLYPSYANPNRVYMRSYTVQLYQGDVSAPRSHELSAYDAITKELTPVVSLELPGEQAVHYLGETKNGDIVYCECGLGGNLIGGNLMLWHWSDRVAEMLTEFSAGGVQVLPGTDELIGVTYIEGQAPRLISYNLVTKEQKDLWVPPATVSAVSYSVDAFARRALALTDEAGYVVSLENGSLINTVRWPEGGRPAFEFVTYPMTVPDALFGGLVSLTDESGAQSVVFARLTAEGMTTAPAEALKGGTVIIGYLNGKTLAVATN
jgi:hypothetical protein